MPPASIPQKMENCAKAGAVQLETVIRRRRTDMGAVNVMAFSLS
jgi:hypothetical protein